MSRKRADLAVSIAVLVLILGMVWGARTWSPRARLFPWTIGIPTIGLAALQVGFAARNLNVARKEEHEAKPPAPAAPSPPEVGSAVVAEAVDQAFGAGSAAGAGDEIPPDVVRRRVVETCLWIIVFTAGVILLGFKLGSALLTIAFLRLAAQESWRTSLCLALGTYAFFLLIFEVGLNIRLPAGAVFDLLDLESPDAPLVQALSSLVRGF